MSWTDKNTQIGRCDSWPFSFLDSAATYYHESNIPANNYQLKSFFLFNLIYIHLAVEALLILKTILLIIINGVSHHSWGFFRKKLS